MNLSQSFCTAIAVRRLALPSLLLLCSLAVGCATAKPDTQVRYRPEPGEPIEQPYLPENKVNEAINAEINDQAAADESLRNAVGRAELQLAKRYSPAHFFANVTLNPVKEGSNFVGYRITQLSPMAQQYLSRFDQAPQVGDILVSIDGVRQRSPDDFMKVWESMDQQDVITFNLLRGAVEGGDTSGVQQLVIEWPVK